MSGEEYKFNFSTIIPLYNVDEYLKEAIESVISQTLDFEKNIQLILIDDGSTDNSKSIALDYQKKFPNNIIVISKENGGVSSARNLGLKYVTGKYVNFMDPDDFFSNETYKEVYKFFSRNPQDDYDVVSIPIQFFEAMEGDHFLNYKFEEYDGDFVNLYEKDYFVSTIVAFIKNSAIGNLRFDERLSHMEDALFVNKIILNKMRFGLVRNATYFYRKRYSKSSLTNNSIYKKEYFTDRFKFGYMELINQAKDNVGYVPKFLQNYFIYDLRWLVQIPNFNELIYQVFDNDFEINEFYEYLDKILFYIDNEVLESIEIIPNDVKLFLIYLKNKDFHIETTSRKVFLKSNEFILNRMHNHNLWIDIVDFNKGYLNISGTYSTFCDNKYINIVAIKSIKNDKTVFYPDFEDYSKTYRANKEFLSIPWKFYYNFKFKIPISKGEIPNISFKIIYNEDNNEAKMKGKIKFRDYCDLTKESPYYIKDGRIVSNRNNQIFIEDFSTIKLIKNEIKNILNLFRNHPSGFIMGIFYRILYLLSYYFMKNNDIWIFMDRQDSSGDNAEHLFRYSFEKNDDVDKYFIINKDSKDYKPLKTEFGRYIVSFGSIKHKLLYFFANKVISSHPDQSVLNPFYLNNTNLYAGLITSRIYFLQHGVPKYEMPNWLTKFNHNLSLIVAVSDLDYESYIKYYNFDDDIIQILGYPRFDYLSNTHLKKQVLILFSWRNFIKNENMFLSSENYSKINSLVNNKKLIEFFKKTGYELIFKLHPNMVEYADLLNKNDFIKFDETSKIHNLLCDSSLLITDYSSVAFDFAYLKKPVIYYHYGDDYHFDVNSCFFDEKKDGFGDVIIEEDDLVNKICNYLENNCVMEDKFKNNVDTFFKFKDKHNSERVYRWIKSD